MSLTDSLSILSKSVIGSYSPPTPIKSVIRISSSSYPTPIARDSVTVTSSHTDTIPSENDPTSSGGGIEIVGIIAGGLSGIGLGVLITLFTIIIIAVVLHRYHSSRSDPDSFIELEKVQTSVDEPASDVDNDDYRNDITFFEPEYQTALENSQENGNIRVPNPLYSTVTEAINEPIATEDACGDGNTAPDIPPKAKHNPSPPLPEQPSDKQPSDKQPSDKQPSDKPPSDKQPSDKPGNGKANLLPIYSVVQKSVPGVPPKSSDLLSDLDSKDTVTPSDSMTSPVKKMSSHDSMPLGCINENPLYQRSDSLSLPAGNRPINIVHPTPSAPSLEESVYSDAFTSSAPLGTGENGPESMKNDEMDSTSHIYASIYDDPKELPKGFQEPTKIANDNITEIRELGNGHFGKVMLAVTKGLSLKDMRLSKTDDNRDTSILVAVKKLIDHPSTEQQESFIKEVKFMSCLNHKNVVSLLGVCYDEPAFMMMEYMEEGDLNKFLQRYTEIVETPSNDTQLSTSTVVYMASQIASAMKYLAMLNFVHRDLASRNCLIGKNFIIKLADFGMSRNLYESHYYRIHGSATLPIRWMATECYYGIFSEETDVWSFGITMWELFTLGKEKPYSFFTDQEMIDDATERGENRQLLSKPPACPEPVYNIMRQCWEATPKKRAKFSELDKMLQERQ